MLNEQQVLCPYCGEGFDLFIDLSQGTHRTVEDCYVCCRPIEFLIETDGQQITRLEAFTGDETVY